VEDRRAQIENRKTTKLEQVGVYIIASATTLQEAIQPKAGNGALVKVLIDRLKGRQAAEKVWMRDLTIYIKEHLPEVSAQIGQRHTPIITSLGLDFPLISWQSNWEPAMLRGSN
jgi:hypothetical protein